MLLLLLLLLLLLQLLLQVPAQPDNADAELGRDGIPVQCQREGGAQLPLLLLLLLLTLQPLLLLLTLQLLFLLPLTPLHNNPLLHNPHQQEDNTQQPPSGDNPSKLSLRTIPGA